jgi:vacuolar-type H+-ATPase subunit C/Vma6
MSDYDYLNARAKGVSTGLLPPPFYERLLAAEGEEATLDLLHGTAYGPQIAEAISAASGTGRGLAALESALGRHLFVTFASLRAMAPEKPRRLLSVQFSQWDAANVLAVLRGKLSAAEPGEILEALLPFGQASPAQLEELSGQPGLEAVSDTLATWGYPFAPPLRQLIRGQGRKPDLITLESALNGAYYSWALSQAGPEDPQEALVRRMVRLQIDLANVKAGLDYVRHRARGEAMEGPEPLPGGLLPAALVQALRQAASMVDAFEALGASYFAPGIERGILAFGASGSLGVMERFLEAVVIQQGCRLFRGDPLGIGVPLGLLWRKYSEYLNLRLLLRGKSFGMPAAAIREELLYA